MTPPAAARTPTHRPWLYIACRSLELAIAGTVVGWALYHALPYLSLLDGVPGQRFDSGVATVALVGVGMPLGVALILGMLGYAADAMPLGARLAVDGLLLGGVIAVLITPFAGG